jgi:hypothetical protein
MALDPFVRRDESGGQLRLPPGWWVDVAPKNRATSVAPITTAIGVPSAKGRKLGKAIQFFGSDACRLPTRV